MILGDLGSAVLGSGITLALAAAAVLAGRTWISSKITERIKAQHQTSLESYRDTLAQEAVRREKAAKTADLLAAWVAPNWDPSKRNNCALLDVQRRYWELVLWLDEPALRALITTLAGRGDTREALLKVRETMLGPDSNPFAGEDLNQWRPIDWSLETYPEFGDRSDTPVPPGQVTERRPPEDPESDEGPAEAGP